MKYPVWMFSNGLGERREPVFHDWARPNTTRCGKRLDNAFQILTDHAVKFARPCSTCWPGER